MKGKISNVLNLIDKGEIGAARGQLAELWNGRHDRASRLLLAQAARRVRAPEKALRLLHGVVRGDSSSLARPNALPQEVAEYAVSLSELGASDEALRLFELPLIRKLPKVRLHSALTHIRLWDWEAAERSLEEVLQSTQLTENTLLSAQVYLGSCILHGRRDLKSADTYFGQLIQTLDRTNFGVHQRSARLLRAQSLCFLGNWDESERLLLAGSACEGATTIWPC